MVLVNAAAASRPELMADHHPVGQQSSLRDQRAIIHILYYSNFHMMGVLLEQTLYLALEGLTTSCLLCSNLEL